MKNTGIITLVAFVLIFIQSIEAYACSVAPQRAQVDKQLRELIQSGDFVFIGQVTRITRRAWGPNDDPGWYEKRWKILQEKGREVPPYIQNMMEFSDATARLTVKVSLRDDDFGTSGGHYRHGKKLIDIDLLRPFSQAGHGPCTNFPRTCPWDIKTGDFVVVAVEEKQALPFAATYCLKIDRPSLEEETRAVELRGKIPAEELVWGYIEEARLRFSLIRMQNGKRPPKREP